jgi:hypothetical protein
MAVISEQRPRPTPSGAADPYDRLVTESQTAAPETGSGSQPAYNSDTRPVVVGVVPNPVSSISRTPDTMADRGASANVTNVYEAKKLLSFWRSQRVTGDETYDSLVGLLRRTGYLGPRSTSHQSVEDAWTDALVEGAYLFENNPGDPTKADVFSYLYSLEPNGADDPNGGGGGSSGSGFSATSTVDLTDPGTAENLVDQALTQYLGRKASDKEVANFRRALAANERANPRTVSQGTTTTRTKDGKEVTETSSATVERGGGFNPSQFAQDWAEEKQGVAEYQAATTFLDSFIGSLKNPLEVA